MSTDAHGRYAESTLQGRRFLYSVSAAFVPPLTSGTAATCGLYNPPNSGVNAIIDDIIVAFATAPSAATSLYLVGNTGISTTPAGLATNPPNARGAFLSRPGAGFLPLVQPFTACTLPAAPFVMRLLSTILASGAVTLPVTFDEIAGRIVLAPGSIISIASGSASNNAAASFTWEEVVA